ncbi:hypothetical protein Psi01_30910 [Planobispora siamensis]|uniref:Uncharacterized protein n=1 Tax=Planobispora siamensis TaxID=936338 RepID=A0A8J3WM35_9ACTN|nr:hypothetical protein Psi01_30910 [Planobispora siamensis]
MADFEVRAQDRKTGLGEFLCDQYDGLVHWWFLRDGKAARTSRSLSALVNAFTSVPGSETPDARAVLRSETRAPPGAPDAPPFPRLARVLWGTALRRPGLARYPSRRISFAEP